ncbi:hypothetical protein Vi05172_g4722 [Venturia inaequalis]|nr:hypothetical protein Vi05172_g4722 [Venturia inaequalis]
MKRIKFISNSSRHHAESAQDNKRAKTTPASNMLENVMDYTNTSDRNPDANGATEGQESNTKPKSILSLPAELRQMVLFESFRGNDKKVYDTWSARRLRIMIAEWVSFLVEVHPSLQGDVSYVKSQWLKAAVRKEKSVDLDEALKKKRSEPVVTFLHDIKFHMRMAEQDNVLDWWNCNMIGDRDMLKATEEYPTCDERWLSIVANLARTKQLFPPGCGYYCL